MPRLATWSTSDIFRGVAGRIAAATGEATTNSTSNLIYAQGRHFTVVDGVQAAMLLTAGRQAMLVVVR